MAAGPALVVLLTATGCGIPADGAPRALDPAAAPFRAVVAEASPAPSGNARALIYLVHDGVLVAVTRRVPQPPTAVGVLQALAAGSLPREGDAGLTSSLPAGVAVRGGVLAGGLLRVEVPAADAPVAARTDEVLGFAQIVLSLTALSGVRGVVFVRDDEPLAVPRGDGSLTTAALTRRDYAELL